VRRFELPGAGNQGHSRETVKPEPPCWSYATSPKPFAVPRSWTVSLPVFLTRPLPGIIGPNGAGKSTLLDIIAGSSLWLESGVTKFPVPKGTKPLGKRSWQGRAIGRFPFGLNWLAKKGALELPFPLGDYRKGWVDFPFPFGPVGISRGNFLDPGRILVAAKGLGTAAQCCGTRICELSKGFPATVPALCGPGGNDKALGDAWRTV